MFKLFICQWISLRKNIMLVEILTLLILCLTQIEAGCISGTSLSLGRRCQLYMKCHEEHFIITKCINGYFFDHSIKSCVLGEADKSCDEFKYLDISSNDNKKDLIPDKKELNIAIKLDDEKSSTDNNYWTGTDGSGITGTDWPINEVTTEDHYWTGTNGPDITASLWPKQEITTIGDIWTGTDGTGSGTEWINQEGFTRSYEFRDVQRIDGKRVKQEGTTGNNYWTGTDGTIASGTEWPFQRSTTPGGYWTGTDSTDVPGTNWPHSESTTDGNLWTGTDGTPATGTNWPIFSSTQTYPSSKHITGHWPTITQEIPTENYFTATEGSQTEITEKSETPWTESPSSKPTTSHKTRPPITTKTTKPTTTHKTRPPVTTTKKPNTKTTTLTPWTEPSSMSTATDWTAPDNTVTVGTGTEWTVTESSKSTGTLWTVKINPNITKLHRQN